MTPPLPGCRCDQAGAAHLEACPHFQRPGWYWLSFAKPGAFLGCVVVRARSAHHALLITHARKINPGGEVQTTLPPSPNTPDPPPGYDHRLLTKADAERLDREWGEIIGAWMAKN